ncbi:hypothetical protein DFH09DRAFT_1096077 [Mycena vulgaris]|nr:hypothetical protein DFH09DRAFT_1096077 [Mycena vulgaris]
MPQNVLPHALPQSTASAHALRAWCATTPGMNVYQPIAASAVGICSAAALLKKGLKGDKLAAYVVDRTTVLIDRMVHVALSPDISQFLDIFEQKLDAIRRHIEQIQPVGSSKVAKLLRRIRFKGESGRLKAELEDCLQALLTLDSTHSVLAEPSRSECVLEVISLSTRAAGAVCEAPGLSYLKPVVGIAALICETAKTVKSNRDAAVELAGHARTVTTCIVDRASAMSTNNDGTALEALKLTLKEIQSYLILLAKPRRRLRPWIFANQQKERFVQLNAALDKALAMFSATKILSTAEDVRATAVNVRAITVDMRPTAIDVGVLVASVERLERSDNDVKGSLTIGVHYPRLWFQSELADLRIG